MQVTNAFIAALFAANSVLAAPTPTSSSEVEASTPAPSSEPDVADLGEWTIDSLKRECNKDDTQCDWTFKIETDSGESTDCTFTIKGKKASEKQGGPSECGHYTITSGWSGQFGPGEGFTTMSVIDPKKKLIVWPAYKDEEVESGEVFTPNKKYVPIHVDLP